MGGRSKGSCNRDVTIPVAKCRHCRRLEGQGYCKKKRKVIKNTNNAPLCFKPASEAYVNLVIYSTGRTYKELVMNQRGDATPKARMKAEQRAGCQLYAIDYRTRNRRGCLYCKDAVNKDGYSFDVDHVSQRISNKVLCKHEVCPYRFELDYNHCDYEQWFKQNQSFDIMLKD